ncbi:hypothetical protein D3C72_740270 [compost metagenome]
MQTQQPRTDRAKTLGLDESAEPGDEQRHADQVRDFTLQTEGAAHDQGWGDDADEAGQHVLQRGKHCGGQVRTIVEAVNQVVVARGFFRGGHGVLRAARRGRVRKWRRRMPEEGGKGNEQ